MFTDEGYEHVPAERLVAEAGVTRGALYHHFDDKRDLFRALVEEMEAELAQRITAAAIGADTAWGAMLVGAQTVLEAWENRG